MDILKELFFVFWFFAPAGVANMMAFFSGKIPFLKPFTYPVDFFLKINGKRVLGSHKTIRGFIVGTLAAVLIVYFEVFLYQQIPLLRTILPLNYEYINPLLLGGLLGLGALVGDSVKSFFKRRMKISPGKSWVPFDQIDFILGGMLFSTFYIQLSLLEYCLLFIVWLVIHPAISFSGYLFRLKKDPV
jgi:CDP-2,3-bis-(O-geranylgeranyl)-sn-glycerol synthase